MKKFRQVANVEADNGNYTLVNVIVKIEDADNGVKISRQKDDGTVYTSVTALFSAIKTNVEQVLNF
jgi:hypothetical protein